MKKRTFIIITIVLILVAVAAILWQTGVFANLKLKKSKKTDWKKTDSNNNSDNSDNSILSSISGYTTVTSFPVKKGNKGNPVTALQVIMNAVVEARPQDKLKKITVDGKFGDNTASLADSLLNTNTKTGGDKVTEKQYDFLVDLVYNGGYV